MTGGRWLIMWRLCFHWYFRNRSRCGSQFNFFYRSIAKYNLNSFYFLQFLRFGLRNVNCFVTFTICRYLAQVLIAHINMMQFQLLCYFRFKLKQNNDSSYCFTEAGIGVCWLIIILPSIGIRCNESSDS